MRPPADLRNINRRRGTDKFGNFHLTGGPCTHCSQDDNLCVHYRFPGVQLPEGIKPEDTILQPRGIKVDDTYLGINCGCYAKLHRQVTHIEEKMKQRSHK